MSIFRTIFRRPGGALSFGVTPVAITLQFAFNGGNTIDESTGAHAGDPVSIANNGAAIAGNALVQVTADANMAALLLTQSSDAAALRIAMSGPTTRPTIDVEAGDLTQSILRLQDTILSLSTVLHGKGIVFAGGASAAQVPLVAVETGSDGSTGPQLLFATGSASPGAACADLIAGFNADASFDGGFVLQGASGRMQLRTHNLATSGAPQMRGALQLHNLTGLQLDAQTPEEGDVLLVTDATSVAPNRTRGFPAYRGGAYGLLGRGYQISFTEADLSVGGDLAVTHNLFCRALMFQVTNNNGLAVNPDLVLTWTNGATGDTNATGTLNVAGTLRPLSGTWWLTLMGF